MRSLTAAVLIAGLLSSAVPAQTPAPAWTGYGRDPQHTAISPVAAQSLTHIHWQTPVDLQPQYSGNDLFIHYGSPAITAANTVIVPVKTGATDGFRVEGRRGSNGSLLWSMDSGYTLPPHNWTPPFGITLTPTNKLCFPGVAGTINYRNNPDAAASVTGTWVFYGRNNLYANIPAYKNSIQICTPITCDRYGDLFFGYYVSGSNPLGLKSGLARLTPTGVGTYVFAANAAGDASINHVLYNCAPTLSNDEKTLYVAVSNSLGFGQGYLLALDAITLKTVGKVLLRNPQKNATYLVDDGTASPTVGPDGDVYFGTWNGGETHYRGWLLHFSGDLKTTKTPGAFGWDDTASIVPASMVPSYKGSSSYLVMTKYNNYAGGIGGDGHNRIAVQDPNATEISPVDGVTTVMKEVLTVLGKTPDTEFINNGFPGAVREWCINTAAIDPATKSILVNSEDGKAYRWDMVSNTLSETLTLTPGIGEAYTPTVIGPDGTVYAINNATLFALGN